VDIARDNNKHMRHTRTGKIQYPT